MFSLLIDVGSSIRGRHYLYNSSCLISSSPVSLLLTSLSLSVHASFRVTSPIRVLKSVWYLKDGLELGGLDVDLSALPSAPSADATGRVSIRTTEPGAILAELLRVRFVDGVVVSAESVPTR